jgi:aminopeptidase
VEILQKYAHLIVNYCLELKKGQSLYITSTTLAEPLVREVYREALKVGANVETKLSFHEEGKIFAETADEDQYAYVSPLTQYVLAHFDAYLVIRAPFHLKEGYTENKENAKIRSLAMAPGNKLYFERIANGSMKRALCQYPTEAAAHEANMSLAEYEDFVYNACKLNTINPKAAWIQVREEQQRLVDYLNKVEKITYRNDKSDISFSVKGRTWINSDGRSNMPSGEVFTGPIENSVNGRICFDYPSIFQGEEVNNITLDVKDGRIIHWKADTGQELLNHIMNIEGARYFGEVAIGTNYDITRSTKNILFDEKIGGTIHMAIGQSYIQTGGKNESTIHWDMIADMSKNGQIFADDVLIYEKGKFLI